VVTEQIVVWLTVIKSGGKLVDGRIE
jgi:hypothetical protein